LCTPPQNQLHQRALQGREGLPWHRQENVRPTWLSAALLKYLSTFSS
jgi:hypothetical protein